MSYSGRNSGNASLRPPGDTPIRPRNSSSSESQGGGRTTARVPASGARASLVQQRSSSATTINRHQLNPVIRPFSVGVRQQKNNASVSVIQGTKVQPNTTTSSLLGPKTPGPQAATTIVSGPPGSKAELIVFNATEGGLKSTTTETLETSTIAGGLQGTKGLPQILSTTVGGQQNVNAPVARVAAGLPQESKVQPLIASTIAGGQQVIKGQLQELAVAVGGQQGTKSEPHVASKTEGQVQVVKSEPQVVKYITTASGLKAVTTTSVVSEVTKSVVACTTVGLQSGSTQPIVSGPTAGGHPTGKSAPQLVSTTATGQPGVTDSTVSQGSKPQVGSTTVCGSLIVTTKTQAANIAFYLQGKKAQPQVANTPVGGLGMTPQRQASSITKELQGSQKVSQVVGKPQVVGVAATDLQVNKPGVSSLVANSKPLIVSTTTTIPSLLKVNVQPQGIAITKVVSLATSTVTQIASSNVNQTTTNVTQISKVQSATVPMDTSAGGDPGVQKRKLSASEEGTLSKVQKTEAGAANKIVSWSVDGSSSRREEMSAMTRIQNLFKVEYRLLSQAGQRHQSGFNIELTVEGKVCISSSYKTFRLVSC